MDPIAKAIKEKYMKPLGMTWSDLSEKRGLHARAMENSAARGRTPEYWRMVCEEMGWDPAIVDDVMERETENYRSLPNHEVLRNLCETDIAYGISYFEDLKKRNRVTMRVLEVALEYGLVNELDASVRGIVRRSMNSLHNHRE